MNFSLTEDQKMVQSMAREFATPPNEDEKAAEESFQAVRAALYELYKSASDEASED